MMDERDDIAHLIYTLRSFREAYPEDMFGPVTAQEIKDHPSLISRNSAAMGRHCAKFMAQAADALLRLQRERDQWKAKLLAEETEHNATLADLDCAYERAAKVCEAIAKEDADYGYEASASRMRETASRIRSLTSGRDG